MRTQQREFDWTVQVDKSNNINLITTGAHSHLYDFITSTVN